MLPCACIFDSHFCSQTTSEKEAGPKGNKSYYCISIQKLNILSVSFGFHNTWKQKINVTVESWYPKYLQVQTRQGSSSDMESPMELNSGSKRQESGNIEEILTCGNILHNDLQMINVLGSGNAGTVHR